MGLSAAGTLCLANAAREGVRLYVGTDGASCQGRRLALTGCRAFSAAYGPNSPYTQSEVPAVRGLLDSGAFSDPPARRLSPFDALERQLCWEQRASEKWQAPFTSEALASYDLLIDETWTDGVKAKRRWSLVDAERAVAVTVDAAAYLALQRRRLWPRRLILACQGVDAVQYAECAAEVLRHARPGDWLGLGGWCILGRTRSLLPEFWRTCHMVLPLARSAGLTHVHIFGVTWLPPLGGLLWLADRYGLTVSTDGSKPIMNLTWPDKKKAGALAETWEENVKLWKERLCDLRSSRHYRAPPKRNLLF